MKTKRLLTVLLCLLMVASTVLVACDGGNDGKTETTAATTVATTVGTTAETAGATTAETTSPSTTVAGTTAATTAGATTAATVGATTGITAAATTAGTTAATTAGTTVGTTAGTTAATTTAATTVATTAGTTQPTIPQSLTATVNDADKNLIISRLETPITVKAFEGDATYGDVEVDLQYQGWPTICKGEGNTIYAVSSVRVNHIDICGAIGFSMSTDGGKTWSETRKIIDTPLDDRDAGIVDLGNGHLMVTWFTHDAANYLPGGIYAGTRKYFTTEQLAALDAKLASLEGDAALGSSYVSHSTDGGLTWGEPIAIPVTMPHGPTLMKDGTSLIAVGNVKGPMATRKKEQGGLGLDGGVLYAIKSTDGGYTWTLRGGIPRNGMPGACEPHVIELQDGTLLTAIRYEPTTDALGMKLSRSTNGGRTWSDPEELPKTAGGPGHFLELDNGVLVLTYSYRTNPTGIRARYSTDGGVTWSRKEIVLCVSAQSPAVDLGYPSSIQLDDGTILTAYYQPANATDGYCSFLFTRWTLTPNA